MHSNDPEKKNEVEVLDDQGNSVRGSDGRVLFRPYVKRFASEWNNVFPSLSPQYKLFRVGWDIFRLVHSNVTEPVYILYNSAKAGVDVPKEEIGFIPMYELTRRGAMPYTITQFMVDGLDPDYIGPVVQFYVYYKYIHRYARLYFLRSVLNEEIWDEDRNNHGKCCVICMYDYVGGDEICVTKCGHAYHKSCINEWFTYGHPFCPECRHCLLDD